MKKHIMIKKHFKRVHYSNVEKITTTKYQWYLFLNDRERIRDGWYSYWRILLKVYVDRNVLSSALSDTWKETGFPKFPFCYEWCITYVQESHLNRHISVRLTDISLVRSPRRRRCNMYAASQRVMSVRHWLDFNRDIPTWSPCRFMFIIENTFGGVSELA